MKERPALAGFDRERQYIGASRLIRWVCLILVTLTYPYDGKFSVAVFTLIVAMAGFNGLTYLRVAQRPLVSPFNSLAVDHVFVLALVLLSGGLASPFYPLFFLLIVAVIIRYGFAGLAFSLASQVMVSSLLLLLHIHSSIEPQSEQIQFIIKLIFVIIFSVMAQQAVRNREEEDQLETQFTSRLENERERLLALINSLSSAVLAVNREGLVYLHNAAALELLNTNRNIDGLHASELLPLMTDKNEHVDVGELVSAAAGVVSRRDLVYPSNDGSRISLDLTVTPVHVSGIDPSDDGGGSMVVFHDITKQKSLEEERDEFISVASHELRTPLAIAEANLSTALLPGYAKIDAKAVKLLNQSHDNMMFLSQIIQDLTTLSRAERGKFTVQRSLIDLKSLLAGMAKDYGGQAKAKGLVIKTELSPEAHQVYTSENEVREVVQNFITNAIKYTQTGSITLKLEHHRDRAVVSVKDTGIGISASDKTKVFQKFYRSEDYRTRETGGTGLGLYITKKLVERLGLAIEFSSRLNVGSTFKLIIPYEVRLEENDQTGSV